jgi:hypothetical protein
MRCGVAGTVRYGAVLWPCGIIVVFEVPVDVLVWNSCARLRCLQNPVPLRYHVAGEMLRHLRRLVSISAVELGSICAAHLVCLSVVHTAPLSHCFTMLRLQGFSIPVGTWSSTC